MGQNTRPSWPATRRLLAAHPGHASTRWRALTTSCRTARGSCRSLHGPGEAEDREHRRPVGLALREAEDVVREADRIIDADGSRSPAASRPRCPCSRTWRTRQGRSISRCSACCPCAAPWSAGARGPRARAAMSSRAHWLSRCSIPTPSRGRCWADGAQSYPSTRKRLWILRPWLSASRRGAPTPRSRPCAP
jgi:hypothetical protein